MADPFLEISRTLREEQFDRYAAYRVDGIEYPPAQDIMAIGFRKDKYESDDGGFKGYGDPKPIGKRPSRVPKIDYDKKWLKDDVVEFAKPKIWKGIGILGRGGQGRVGLWKWTGKGKTLPYKYVAVKNALSGSLDKEAASHWAVNQARSPHILKLLKQPIQRPDENDPSGKPHVRHLLMEYCDLGDLHKLISRRRDMAKPFLEATLWQFFNCFVDGLCVLAHGQEPKYDELKNTATIPITDWDPVCHFDFKPLNIMLGENQMTHPVTPVLKIADFGLAHTLTKPKLDSKNWRERRRGAGTPGYWTPEQFTKRWNYMGWETDGVSGVYTSSNLFQIGLMMWQLVMLSTKSPIPPAKEYSPRNDIKGWVPLGKTYGQDMRDAPYSALLRKTIFECLYEKPALRPKLLDLKARVKMGWRAAKLVNPEMEPWESFQHPGPPEVEWNPDTWDSHFTNTDSDNDTSDSTYTIHGVKKSSPSDKAFLTDMLWDLKATEAKLKELRQELAYMNPYILHKPQNSREAYFQIPRGQLGYDPSDNRAEQARVIHAANALSQKHAKDAHQHSHPSLPNGEIEAARREREQAKAEFEEKRKQLGDRILGLYRKAAELREELGQSVIPAMTGPDGKPLSIQLPIIAATGSGQLQAKPNPPSSSSYSPQAAKPSQSKPKPKSNSKVKSKPGSSKHPTVPRVTITVQLSSQPQRYRITNIKLTLRIAQLKRIIHRKLLLSKQGLRVPVRRMRLLAYAEVPLDEDARTLESYEMQGGRDYVVVLVVEEGEEGRNARAVSAGESGLGLGRLRIALSGGSGSGSESGGDSGPGYVYRIPGNPELEI